MATGELADAIHSDLLSDRLTFDELGWRGLWAYVTKARPISAVHLQRTEGFGVGEELQLESFNEQREINWRYTALHFEGGKDVPFPERLTKAGILGQEPIATSSEPMTLEELIPPHVRALLQGV